MNRSGRRKLPRAERHPVSGQKPQNMTADELQRRLVEDAVKGFDTPLAWALHAYLRIAALRRCSMDEAYLSVRQECAEWGVVSMPMAPGS